MVLLNWNGIAFLEQFMDTVVKRSPEAEIYLADNGSEDNSVAYMEEHFPSVKIVALDKNYGFAKGYNESLKQITADYYILLNTDIEVTENWIPPLIALLESDEKIACCQPKVKSYHQKQLFEHAGAAGGYIDKFGYAFCRGRVFKTIEEDIGQYDDLKEIFWATGACLCIRAELFHSTGAFDENFFAHMEEIDLCWRLKNRGYRIMYCPTSTVYHVGGGTLAYASPRKTYLNFRNNLLMMRRNMYGGNYFLKMVARLWLDQVAALKFIFGGQFTHFAMVLKAHLSYCAHYFEYVKIRKQLKRKATTNQLTGIYNGSIVIDYFARSKKHFSQFSRDKFS